MASSDKKKNAIGVTEGGGGVNTWDKEENGWEGEVNRKVMAVLEQIAQFLFAPPKYLSTLWAPFPTWFSDIPKHSIPDSRYEMCEEQSQLL